MSLWGAVTEPGLLAPGDPWEYRCLNCRLVVQGGWDGVLAHFEVVHPDRPTPTRPTPPPRQETQRALYGVPTPPAGHEPPGPPQAPHKRTHGRKPQPPQEDTLF